MAAARQSRPVRPAAAPARPVATTAPPVPQAVVPAGAAPAPVPRRMPGPRLYRIIRAVLVILTLAASAACVGSLVISQANQQAAAASTAHAQDLRDLRVEAAAAQSAALASFTSTGVWSEYGDAAAEVDVDLLAAAASAPQSSDLGELARTIREWHNAIVIAHQTADNPPLTTVTQAYHTVSMTLDAISTTEQSRSSTFNT
ncbi:MAG: hypothetical protein LBI33_12320, partial [Propionibacteriaceae bacterium]|nr:hypothetical protein [Propionibacteriaceae bacterium]